MNPWLERGLVAAMIAPLIGGGGWAGVGLIVESIANGALESRGMRCEPIDVSFAWDLSSSNLGPTTCTFEEGRLRELRVTGVARAELDEDRRVTSIDASGLELDLAEDPPHAMVMGLVDGEVPERLRASLVGLAELAARDDLPDVSVRRVLLRRRQRFVSFRHVRVTREGEALSITVERVAPPPVGRDRLRVETGMADLAIRATPAEASVRGRLELAATIGRREIDEAVPFELHGAGLDGDAPTFDADVQLSENLRELRERNLRRRAEAEARASEPPGPPPRESIRALRDSLRDTVASMRSGDEG